MFIVHLHRNSSISIAGKITIYSVYLSNFKVGREY
jgi:hypothetical protein